MVNISFRKKFIQDGNDGGCESNQPLVGIGHFLARMHRRDQLHQRPVGPLSGERVPEVVKLHLPGIGQHPVARGKPEVGKLVWGTFLPEGPDPAG